MKQTFEQYQREFAELVKWDPDQKNEDGTPTLTPDVEIDLSKALHVIKRYIIDYGLASEYEAAGKDTVYKTLKQVRFGDLVMLMAGKYTPEEILKQIKSGKRSGDSTLLDINAGNKFEAIREWQDAQRILHKLSSVLAVDVGGKIYTCPDGTAKTAIDTLLGGAGLPAIDTILGELKSSVGVTEAAKAEAHTRSKEVKKANKEIDRLTSQVADLSIKVMAKPMESIEIKGDETGEIPDGKLVFKKAKEIFPHVNIQTDFELPFWEWDGDHPYVPQVDEKYVFRADYLERVLYAMVMNKRGYLHGHTGSGKTTLLEQVAAHLNFPFVRINFDSEITRMDLIGRDVLTSERGETKSEFVDGMLPRAMSMPCILCCDEVDFVRPDVAYVMQAALEGNGLRITEDGDRYIKPHPMMRMFATGNTVGQGDEHGMYQGARPQSLALLDRFTVWVKVDYMTEDERKKLVSDTFPAMKKEDQDILAKYIKEHLAAFKQSDVIQPITPRGMLGIAEATIILGDIKKALTMTVLDKANKDDYATFKGIVDRVV